MRTLVILAAVVASVASAAAAPLKPQDLADLSRISAYLNTITSLKSNFVQVGPNGELDQGVIYARKPGRLRFEYAPPSPYLSCRTG